MSDHCQNYCRLNDDITALRDRLDRGYSRALDNKELRAAVADLTRGAMWRLRHIPNRYFIIPELRQHLTMLADEMSRVGYIDLDADGEPACISGKPAAIQPIPLQQDRNEPT